MSKCPLVPPTKTTDSNTGETTLYMQECKKSKCEFWIDIPVLRCAIPALVLQIAKAYKNG